MGETTPWTGSRDLALKVFADDASQMLFTPDSLYAIAGYTFKRIGNAVMEDGETPKEVVFSHPNGESVKFVFNEGESLARPDPNVHIPMDERLQMVDAQGWATTKNPIYWDLYLGDGRVRRYVATPDFNERGRFLSERDARGRVITAEEMGIDVVYDMSGIRQFLTPSRLADVKSFVEGYEVKIYVLQDAPKKDASSGLYPVPNTKPYRVLTIKRENDDYRAVVTVKTGDQEAKKYIFNYAMGDWELIRPNGVKEVKDRMIAEEIAARLSKAVISASGKLMSKEVMTYKYESWGYAMTNKVDGFDGVERNTSWTYFTSGGGKGKLKTSLEHSGLLTTYAYDEQGRKISEKRSGPDMMTEVTTYDYTPVDGCDPMLPVDTRPRTIVKTLNGIECERTYYVYAPLTNIVERVGTQGAAYGGTNVLRTVVAYYPVVSNDLRSGRVRSRRHEDGKLDL
jgi:YD repeat-containing protein